MDSFISFYSRLFQSTITHDMSDLLLAHIHFNVILLLLKQLIAGSQSGGQEERKAGGQAGKKADRQAGRRALTLSNIPAERDVDPMLI